VKVINNIDKWASGMEQRYWIKMMHDMQRYRVESIEVNSGMAMGTTPQLHTQTTGCQRRAFKAHGGDIEQCTKYC
jgi:hypothetical protein